MSNSNVKKITDAILSNERMAKGAYAVDGYCQATVAVMDLCEALGAIVEEFSDLATRLSEAEAKLAGLKKEWP